MANNIQAIRGMHDVLSRTNTALAVCGAPDKDVLGAYGYSEIRCPSWKRPNFSSALLAKSTDIVEKEMYTFEDRNGDP